MNTSRGLLKRREKTVLTWKGWLLLILLLAAMVVVIVRNIHPFLAASHTLGGDILVVEGWVTYPILKETIRHFHDNGYRRILTVGGPMDPGLCSQNYPTYAALARTTLVELGLDPARVVAVPAPPVRTDRTFASAVALREWLSRADQTIDSLDVVSVGAHARRTRFLFQEAMGDRIAVGVLAMPNPEYDADSWWKWSSGVRDVMGETIAYLYARFVFVPHGPQTGG